MDAPALAQLIDLERDDAPSLAAWGVADVHRARAALAEIVASGMPLDLLAGLATAWTGPLAATGDADRVLGLLTRFICASRSPLALGALFEREPESLSTLIQVFAASQQLGERLTLDPESFDLVRMTQGRPIAREHVVDDALAEVQAAAGDERAAMAAIRRFKHRETLRIAYGDIVGRQGVETVSRQISHVADALIHAAVHVARQRSVEPKPPPQPNGQPPRFAVIALGKLGGQELNYSSDVDLMFVYEAPADPARRAGAQEHFDRVARGAIRLLSEQTADGFAYRVDTRLRPNGQAGRLTCAVDDALAYYDVSGRTWERQTLIKARAIAGDLDLGEEFLASLAPWIWRRYLSRADIGGIRALKRRIERRALREDVDDRDLKTGRGGLRDVEFAVQFLQLLNGGDLPDIRVGGTFEAIRRLEAAKCLTPQERSELETHYALLRKLEHRLQIMFDLRTHRMPDGDDETRKLALRSGYVDTPPGAALSSLRADLTKATAVNRKILDHLLHSAFPSDDDVEAETDLILDPDPRPETIAATLAPYRFVDSNAAFANLSELGTERVRFLSTRRCRHFLASIAPRLLKAVSGTSDPDFTLANLARVSDSLGGKGVLWELFSFNPPTLQLYVRLCGASAYLSDILVGSPGMLDELLDSLSLDRLPDRAAMAALLAEWTRAAGDPAKLLHNFKESMHLCVGVRELLRKDGWNATHAALSDVAETIVEFVVERERNRLIDRWGEPIVAAGPRQDAPCGAIVLALGKLGGREIDYRSDLDLAFLYDGDGSTRQPPSRKGKPTTTNAHFFQQLAQKTMQALSERGPLGKLYEVDARLRPGGSAGPLALSTAEFARRHTEGQAAFWERQALCQARPVVGDRLARISVAHAARQALLRTAPTPEELHSVHENRRKIEQTAAPLDMKRAAGGTTDVAFMVQVGQMQRAAELPEVPIAGTLDALDALAKIGAWPDPTSFRADYSLLRQVKSALRLASASARNDLPEDRRELSRLAYLLGRDDPEALAHDVRAAMTRIRARFVDMFGAMHGST